MKWTRSERLLTSTPGTKHYYVPNVNSTEVEAPGPGLKANTKDHRHQSHLFVTKNADFSAPPLPAKPESLGAGLGKVS